MKNGSDNDFRYTDGYGYRYYSPQLGRFANRDPMEERGGRNLYLGERNNAINLIDVLGLTCSKSGTGVGVNWKIEGAMYTGIGGKVWLVLGGMVWDCCCDGQTVKRDAWEVKLEGGVSVGLGAGMHVTLPLVGMIGGEILGPQVTKTTSVQYTKECGEANPSLSWTVISMSADIGGGFSIGESFGVSASYWAKYGIDFTMKAIGKTVGIEGKVGWKGGGEWEIITPIANVNGTFGEFDYQWNPHLSGSI